MASRNPAAKRAGRPPLEKTLTRRRPGGIWIFLSHLAASPRPLVRNPASGTPLRAAEFLSGGRTGAAIGRPPAPRGPVVFVAAREARP